MSAAKLVRIAAAWACLMTALALPASVAGAGSYTVSACSPFATSGPWAEVDTFPAGLMAGNMCGGPAVGPLGGGNEGALYAEDNAQNAGTEIPNNAHAGWAFAAPTGTVITGVTYYRDLEIAPTSDDLVVGLFDGNGARLETCQGTFENHYACSLPNNQAPRTVSGLAATGLFFGIECQLQPAEEHCLSGSPGHQLASADMYSVTVTLTEQSSPVVSGESGPLWGGGVVWGTVPLGFQASDSSGIERLAASDNGSLGASAQESCEFTQTVPCPQLQPGGLSVDTTRFPDGHGQVAMTVSDAAGNTTVATSPPVVIDNNGPPAPASLTASAASGSNVVNLAWSDPANPPQPVASAFVQLCQATCVPPVAVSPGGAGQITGPGPGSYTVRLWLLDSAGKGGPQNAATTAVTVPSRSGNGGRNGGPGALRPLRLGAHLGGGRLTVTVRGAAAEHGLVSVHLDLARGKRLVVLQTRKLRARHGVARTVFVLSERIRAAPRLVVAATAAGARSARLTVELGARR
jgi:hypothetical protein